eukprot:542621_1
MSSSEEEELYFSNSNHQLNVDTKYIYHYTSNSNAKKIIRSRFLIPSTKEYNDCLYGVGIYFTSLTPNNCKRDILFNNYGTENAHNEDNANAWIRIKIDKLRHIKRINCNRNVWILPTGSNLNLSKVDAEISCIECDNGNIGFNCGACDGDGIFSVEECTQCDGTGTFGYKECRTCDGNGNGRFICPECVRGSVYVECDMCDGDGGCWCSDCDSDAEVDEQCRNCRGNWNRNNCPHCNATGNFNWRNSEKCNACYGSGDCVKECKRCNGDGDVSCPKCNGHNVIYL